jgi:hypothetical protein
VERDNVVDGVPSPEDQRFNTPRWFRERRVSEIRVSASGLICAMATKIGIHVSRKQLLLDHAGWTIPLGRSSDVEFTLAHEVLWSITMFP